MEYSIVSGFAVMHAHPWAGTFSPPLLFRESLLLELSIFIDESGDFGAYESHAPVYLITLVLHDQSNDISVPIEHLRRKVMERGLPEDHAIHTGPHYLKPTERKRL